MSVATALTPGLPSVKPRPAAAGAKGGAAALRQLSSFGSWGRAPGQFNSPRFLLHCSLEALGTG